MASRLLQSSSCNVRFGEEMKSYARHLFAQFYSNDVIWRGGNKDVGAFAEVLHDVVITSIILRRAGFLNKIIMFL